MYAGGIWDDAREETGECDKVSQMIKCMGNRLMYDFRVLLFVINGLYFY